MTGMEVLGHLFDPAGTESSSERILFLLGVAAGAHAEVGYLYNYGTMSSIEHAALMLIGAGLQPRSAVEAGTFEGGTTEILARSASRVVTIDWDYGNAQHVAHLDNVEFINGRAADMLGRVVAETEPELVLLDADHSADGVVAELTAVLSVPTQDTRIVAIHDAAEQGCRSGLLSMDWTTWPEVAAVSLGVVPRHPDGGGWGGMGLVLTSSRRPGLLCLDLSEPRVERWPS